MTKSITDIAREAGVTNIKGEWYASHEQLEAFAAAIKAAHLEELAGVEMPEPVAQLHPAHWKPNADGSEWCREALLYSPNNEGDKLRGVNTRVKLVTLDQCQQAVAAAVVKKDAEIALAKYNEDTWYGRFMEAAQAAHDFQREKAAHGIGEKQ